MRPRQNRLGNLDGWAAGFKVLISFNEAEAKPPRKSLPGAVNAAKAYTVLQ